jgi:hypothetical protein
MTAYTNKETTNEEIKYNESRDLDAEKNFEKLCEKTLTQQSQVPEHIIDLATRMHRINNLKVVIREKKQNKFQQTISKAKNLAKKAALVRQIATGGVM